jgi:hypothetical protein
MFPEECCVAHRENFGIDDTSEHVLIMCNAEVLLRTMYKMFRVVC